MRNLLFTDACWEDYLYWQTQDKKTLKRINELIKSAQGTPFEGIGKPEALRENLSGYNPGLAALRSGLLPASNLMYDSLVL